MIQPPNALRRAGALLFTLSLLCLALWVGAALPQKTSAQPWQAADLRYLNPNSPGVIAVFYRPASPGCRLRLDFLDLPPTPQYDLTLQNGKNETRFHSGQTPVRTQYDPALDTLTLHLPRCNAEQPISIRIGQENLVILPQSAPPPTVSALGFAFYNSFRASTPLQALRRWDGAHSGPRGERHGLNGLLQAAQVHQIPFTLLDVNTPASLSALDALEALPTLRQLQSQNLLFTPLVEEGQAREIFLALSREAATQHGIQNPGVFYPAQSGSPFPILSAPLSREGLSLSTRQQILQSQPSAPLLLGGDLEQSDWGTYEYAEPAFAWLAARPYLRVTNAVVNLPTLPANLPEQVSALERNVYAMQIALQASALGDVYAPLLGQMQSLETLHACPGYWLNAGGYAALLDANGARLVYLFKDGVQLIGPTPQLMPEMSDPRLWKRENGMAADPAQTLGAFADPDFPLRPYMVQAFSPSHLRFWTEDGREKVYQLSAEGLRVEVSWAQGMQIPLLVAPEIRFEAGWRSLYRLQESAGEVGFGVPDRAWVQVRAGEEIRMKTVSFLGAFPYALSPEDPNATAPPGAFLPFPMALIGLEGGAGEVWLR